MAIGISSSFNEPEWDSAFKSDPHSGDDKPRQYLNEALARFLETEGGQRILDGLREKLTDGREFDIETLTLTEVR